MDQHNKPCTHKDNINKDMRPKTEGCEECLKEGTKWRELRMCMTCGHVGCCDSSIGQHATKHFKQTNHPIMKALPMEASWMWCYVDETYIY